MSTYPKQVDENGRVPLGEHVQHADITEPIGVIGDDPIVSLPWQLALDGEPVKRQHQLPFVSACGNDDADIETDSEHRATAWSLSASRVRELRLTFIAGAGDVEIDRVDGAVRRVRVCGHDVLVPSGRIPDIDGKEPHEPVEVTISLATASVHYERAAPRDASSAGQAPSAA